MAVERTSEKDKQSPFEPQIYQPVLRILYVVFINKKNNQTSLLATFSDLLEFGNMSIRL